jgi:hypothetical protein
MLQFHTVVYPFCPPEIGPCCCCLSLLCCLWKLFFLQRFNCATCNRICRRTLSPLHSYVAVAPSTWRIFISPRGRGARALHCSTRVHLIREFNRPYANTLAKKQTMTNRPNNWAGRIHHRRLEAGLFRLSLRRDTRTQSASWLLVGEAPGEPCTSTFLRCVECATTITTSRLLASPPPLL